MTSNASGLGGKIPFGDLMGKIPDISQYLNFGLYDCESYKDNIGLDVL